MLEPVGHRILVKTKKVEEKSVGGIIIPSDTRTREQRGMEEGEVVALGPNAYKAFDDGTPWVKVGDIVKFQRYEGILIIENEDKPDEVHFRILNDDDIFCKVTKE